MDRLPVSGSTSVTFTSLASSNSRKNCCSISLPSTVLADTLAASKVPEEMELLRKMDAPNFLEKIINKIMNLG